MPTDTQTAHEEDAAAALAEVLAILDREDVATHHGSGHPMTPAERVEELAAMMGRVDAALAREQERHDVTRAELRTVRAERNALATALRFVLTHPTPAE